MFFVLISCVLVSQFPVEYGLYTKAFLLPVDGYYKLEISEHRERKNKSNDIMSMG